MLREHTVVREHCHYFTTVNWTTFLCNMGHRCPRRLTFAKMLKSPSGLLFPSGAFLCIFPLSFRGAPGFESSGCLPWSWSCGLANLQILWTSACSEAGAAPRAGPAGRGQRSRDPTQSLAACASDMGMCWCLRAENAITLDSNVLKDESIQNGDTLYVRVWHLKTNWTYKMALKVNVSCLVCMLPCCSFEPQGPSSIHQLVSPPW